MFVFKQRMLFLINVTFWGKTMTWTIKVNVTLKITVLLVKRDIQYIVHRSKITVGCFLNGIPFIENSIIWTVNDIPLFYKQSFPEANRKCFVYDSGLFFKLILLGFVIFICIVRIIIKKIFMFLGVFRPYFIGFMKHW